VLECKNCRWGIRLDINVKLNEVESV
jgi:hypothetical protein